MRWGNSPLSSNSSLSLPIARASGWAKKLVMRWSCGEREDDDVEDDDDEGEGEVQNPMNSHYTSSHPIISSVIKHQ